MILSASSNSSNSVLLQRSCGIVSLCEMHHRSCGQKAECLSLRLEGSSGLVLEGSSELVLGSSSESVLEVAMYGID